ncbi:hypothetical protein CBR_g26457 [Chara braunii]|uniref:Mitochondrial carrier protein n=1 Tax=Chara braunii TaxID=69332 RepID=A0A388L824_CHABU|nr:hypothetical protein CBR_g26457 [Chara braunii]|eukprot:GBG78428.1 hypothetical protein CBR_g26457 [Chara braunii]
MVTGTDVPASSLPPSRTSLRAESSSSSNLPKTLGAGSVEPFVVRPQAGGTAATATSASASASTAGSWLGNGSHQSTSAALCQTGSSLSYADPPPEAATATRLVPFPEARDVSVQQRVKVPGSEVLSVCKSLLAGGIAGGLSRSAVAPLERMKILLQVQCPLKPKYTGMWQGLWAIGTTEGIKGFFKGNGTNCVRIVPNSAVKFYSYEQASNAILWAFRRYHGNNELEQTPVLRLGAGAVAGIVAMSATYPLDMVRGRLTVQTKDSPRQYRGIVDAALTIRQEEGLRAFYKGWLPSVIGVIPYVGLNFAVYETLKDWVVKSTPSAIDAQDLSVITRLACGAVAGTVGQTVAYPLDVVRRRMQMSGWRDASTVLTADGQIKVLEYNGMLDTFRKTVKYEGFRALYKGLLPNSVKVVPSIAIAFVSYETIKDILGVEFRISE